MDARQFADALRSVARRELERTPGFSLGTVDAEPAEGLSDVRAGDREHAMTGLGTVADGEAARGDTVICLTGPMPLVLGRSPYYRGAR